MEGIREPHERDGVERARRGSKEATRKPDRTQNRTVTVLHSITWGPEGSGAAPDRPPPQRVVLYIYLVALVVSLEDSQSVVSYRRGRRLHMCAGSGQGQGVVEICKLKEGGWTPPTRADA